MRSTYIRAFLSQTPKSIPPLLALEYTYSVNRNSRKRISPNKHKHETIFV